jgi:hypothetical protein
VFAKLRSQWARPGHFLAILICVLIAVATPSAATASGTEAQSPQAEQPAHSDLRQPYEPPSKQGAWVARVLAPSTVYRRPGGSSKGRIRAATPWSGAAQYLMVLRSAVVDGRQWLQVRLPNRPNDAAGWILRDRVWLRRSHHYIEISLSRRTVSLFRDGRRVSTFKAVIGHRRTPTPLGLFAILEAVRQPDPHGFLGPWAIHLTAHSEVLRWFDGGPGRIAIHGRDGASLRDPLGSARSNGCIRVNNSHVRRLAGILPGTPVRIRR